MKSDLHKRLERLEALAKASVNEIDLGRYDLKLAAMAIVSFHSGNLTGQSSQAIAIAETLDMTAAELKQAIGSGNASMIWRRTLDVLNDLVVKRGAMPIMEDGEFILTTPGQGDDRRNGFDVVDELYQEIPEDLKEAFRLLPYFADYLV